jgi:pimeloyl-ACP methyl ester carboxylesterase
MKSFKRLTRLVTVRSGAIAVLTLMALALTSTSAFHVRLAAQAATPDSPKPATRAKAGDVGLPTGTADRSNGAIRPFSVHVPDEKLVDLRRRLAATYFPDKEVVSDRSQGVQLATMKALVRYWQSGYDWRKAEAKLNGLPQFVATIDGLDIHFIHVRSKHPNALPVIITHGWPGSVIELLGIVGPLTDPTAYGGRAEDAFDVVLPSLPGYGFSGEPMEVGWGPGRTARAWAELMSRLGYTRYVAQGGDVGAAVTDAMAHQAPTGLIGVHFNFLINFPPDVLAAVFGGGRVPPGIPQKEQEAFGAAGAAFRRGYLTEQGEHPQTIGYALTDSPVGLAAWMLDHDADSYQKISHAFVDGQPAGDLTRDRILDNITLYWLTSSATSAARMYWESVRARAAAAAQPPGEVSLPVAFTVFPDEIYQAPRTWAERVYRKLIYFHEVDRGGHFAAWEQPQLFSEEIRAAFRSLR